MVHFKHSGFLDFVYRSVRVYIFYSYFVSSLCIYLFMGSASLHNNLLRCQKFFPLSVGLGIIIIKKVIALMSKESCHLAE